MCDAKSFREAQDLLTLIARLKLPSYYTALLLGNQRDLDHIRYKHKRYCRLLALVKISRLLEFLLMKFIKKGHTLYKVVAFPRGSDKKNIYIESLKTIAIT